MSVFCEGDADDDEFELEISTRLKEKDLEVLETGKRLEMVDSLLRRGSDPSSMEQETEQ